MLETLFPLGISQYVVGGLLVGFGIAIPFIVTGTVAAITTFYTSAWSYVTKAAFFNTDYYLASRSWRWYLVVGLIGGGVMYAYVNGMAPTTDVSWWRLFFGGIFVGIGARMGKGCTSGHSICGIAALEKVSVFATVVFLITAIAVALLTESLFI